MTTTLQTDAMTAHAEATRLSGDNEHQVSGESVRTPEGERIMERSPEGRPASPELKRGGTWLMIAGSFAAILVVSIVVLLVWGVAAAGLVLVFGTGLACVGNPVVWAAVLRSEDSEHGVNAGDE